MKTLSSGGVVYELIDFQKQRDMYERTLKAMRSAGKNNTEKYTQLEDALNSLPTIMHGMVAFKSVMPEQDPSEAFILYRESWISDYSVIRGTSIERANGRYQFVVRTDLPYAVLLTRTGGHQSICGNILVYYAGTVSFNDGELDYWNNDTGHFKTTPEYAPQAELPKSLDKRAPLLPLSKYQEFTP